MMFARRTSSSFRRNRKDVLWHAFFAPENIWTKNYKACRNRNDVLWHASFAPENIWTQESFLRECKRHTARRLASTHYAALSNPDLVGGGGIPSRPGRGGTLGTPQTGGVPPTWDGVPLQDLGWGTPQTWDGVPPWPGMGYSPDLGWGTPLTWDGVPPHTWDGVPPYLDLGWGTPPTQTWDGVPPPPASVDRLKI